MLDTAGTGYWENSLKSLLVDPHSPRNGGGLFPAVLNLTSLSAAFRGVNAGTSWTECFAWKQV